MAKKRFENIGNDIFQLGEWWCSAGGEHCADVIATAMNMLIEENDKLKQSIRKQQNECSKYIAEIAKENRELKAILQDMGFTMSNNEIKNLRNEIASKVIKPLCESNGFDVDINTENGFTIIPKETNNDKE